MKERILIAILLPFFLARPAAWGQQVNKTMEMLPQTTLAQPFDIFLVTTGAVGAARSTRGINTSNLLESLAAGSNWASHVSSSASIPATNVYGGGNLSAAVMPPQMPESFIASLPPDLSARVNTNDSRAILLSGGFSIQSPANGTLFFVDLANNAYGVIQTNGQRLVWTNGIEYEVSATNTMWVLNLNAVSNVNALNFTSTNPATGASWNSPTNPPTDGAEVLATGSGGATAYGWAYNWYGTNDATASSASNNVISMTIPGNTLGTNRVLTVDAWGYMDQGSQSATNLTMTFQYGGQCLWGHAVSVAQGASQRPWTLHVQLHMGLTSSRQMISGHFQADGSGPGSLAGIGNLGSSLVYVGTVFGYGTVDMTQSQTLNISAQWASTSASCDFAVLGVAAKIQ